MCRPQVDTVVCLLLRAPIRCRICDNDRPTHAGRLHCECEFSWCIWPIFKEGAHPSGLRCKSPQCAPTDSLAGTFRIAEPCWSGSLEISCALGTETLY